jgi:hypothetical protein
VTGNAEPFWHKAGTIEGYVGDEVLVRFDEVVVQVPAEWLEGWSNNNAKGLIQPSQNGFGSEAFGEGGFALPSISLSRRPPFKSIFTAWIWLREELNAGQSMSVQVPAEMLVPVGDD